MEPNQGEKAQEDVVKLFTSILEQVKQQTTQREPQPPDQAAQDFYDELISWFYSSPKPEPTK